MKSAKIAGDTGYETRVVILDSGEEAFAALTKFANDAQLTAASLTAIGAFEKATVDGSILKTRLTKGSRSEKRPITGSALRESTVRRRLEDDRVLIRRRRRGQRQSAAPGNDDGATRESAYHAREGFASEHDSAPGSDGSRNPRRSRGDPNLRRCEVASMPCRAGHVPCP